MKLYHGTDRNSAKNIEKHGVNLSYSRKNLDFGAGFYLTVNKGQAKNWAYKNGPLNAAVITFEADFDDLKIKKFDDFDLEWGNTIYENRVNENDNLRDYDVIIGKMADGKLSDLVDDVKEGIMTKADFIKEISRDIGHQTVFKSSKSLIHLKYVGREVLR